MARFFARVTTFAFIIQKNAIMSNIFLRKIAKMLTINHILHEFRFFVKLFLKKIPDDSVVLISVVRARLSPNGLGSGDPNLQGGAVGNVNDENVPYSVVCDRLIANRSRSGDFDL